MSLSWTESGEMYVGWLKFNWICILSFTNKVIFHVSWILSNSKSSSSYLLFAGNT